MTIGELKIERKIVKKAIREILRWQTEISKIEDKNPALADFTTWFSPIIDAHKSLARFLGIKQEKSKASDVDMSCWEYLSELIYSDLSETEIVNQIFFLYENEKLKRKKRNDKTR